MKVYHVIISAKTIYISETSHLRYPGMCWCLKATKAVPYAGLDFWWETKDVKSRLNAFEVLESIYKESVREFEY